MQGKHTDHDFDFFGGENEKKWKVLRIAWFGEKIDQKKFLKFFTPPPPKKGVFAKKNRKMKKGSELPDFERKLIWKSF